MDGSLTTNPIRTLTANDLPWGLSLAWERYAPFDPGAAVLFYLAVLKSETTLRLRTDHAFLIATITNAPWQPTEKECSVLILCAAPEHHWDAVKLARESLAWSRAHKCKRWCFTSNTTHNVGALCLRIGARPRQPRYCVEM